MKFTIRDKECVIETMKRKGKVMYVGSVFTHKLGLKKYYKTMLPCVSRREALLSLMNEIEA